MNRIKRFSYKVFEKDYFPVVIFVIVLLSMHWLMQAWGGDEYSFAESLHSQSLIQYIVGRYHEWSSRILIDMITVLVLHVSMSLWKLLDIVIFVTLVFSLEKVFSFANKRAFYSITICFLLMYPYQDFYSAGWSVTSINYLWPAVFAVISCISIRKAVERKKIAWFEGIGYLVATTFACNMEQIDIIMIGIFAVATFYLYTKKVSTRMVFLQFLVAFGEMIFILTTPGVHKRAMLEIAHSFPDYSMLTVGDKLDIGIFTTAQHLLLSSEPIFLLLCFALAAGVWLRTKDSLYRAISGIPLAACLTMGLLKDHVLKIAPGIDIICNAVTRYGVIDLNNFDKRSTYIPIIVIGMIFLCLLLSVYVLYGNTYKSYWLILLLLMGLGSRVIMGFSPTVYTSGNRTYFPLLFTFIICNIILYYDLIERMRSNKKAIVWMLRGAATVIFLSFCMYIP